MSLLAILRKARTQGKEAAGRRIAQAGEMWQDAERKIRRKMRIRHQPANPAARENVKMAANAWGRAV